MIKNVNRLFVNDMMELPLNELTHTISNELLSIEYSLNSLGYRSQEFDGKSDVLFLGCSNTYGQGLPEEDIWPTLLAKKLNLSWSNLGSRGDSIMGQVSKAFYYFEKFGNPKIIVALFPFSRIMSPYVKGKMKTKNSFKRKFFEKHDYMPMIEYSETWGSFELYAKAPYDPQLILPEEFVFFYENIFIDMLRQYCKSNNIKLVWSNWDPMYQIQIYSKVNLFYPDHYKEYCYMDLFDCKIPNEYSYQDRYGIDNYLEHNYLDCHIENNRDHALFYRGSDRANGHMPHWGFHKHLHIAENFYDHISGKSIK